MARLPFVDKAPQLLAHDGLSRLVVTDSVPPLRLPDDGPVRGKLHVVSAVPLFAEAVRASHGSWRQ